MYVSREVWTSGLVHVMIDILQFEFEEIEGKWNTAGRIASLLAIVMPGCPPDELQALKVCDMEVFCC